MIRMFDTKVWRRTRTDCLSYYCPQLPLVCFLKHHRSRTYVQGAFLLQNHAPHIFFKIGGNETNKSPPIIHFNLYIFHMLSPYPQCLIVFVGLFFGCSLKPIKIFIADMAFRGLHALSELHCMKTLTYRYISSKPLLRIS